MILYRGENIVNGDVQKVHTLKTLLRYGFPLDFINGGNPHLIQNRGFLPSTVDQVLNDNVINGRSALKVFTSFSANRGVAKKYATGYLGGSFYNDLGDCLLYEEDHTYNHSSANFDFELWAITDHLMINLNIGSAVDATPGHGYLKILNYGNHKLLLLDCKSYLEKELYRRTLYGMDTENLVGALELATRDEEWLVLSLDQIQSGTQSAILAHGVFSIIHFLYFN